MTTRPRQPQLHPHQNPKLLRTALLVNRIRLKPFLPSQKRTKPPLRYERK
jgi:hypothetical protein